MSDTILRLELPFPPTVNTYWRHVGNQTLISRLGREYKDAVAAVVFETRSSLRIDYPVGLSVCHYPPDKRKRDLDNYFKALFDSLEHSGVLTDDSVVQSIVACWGEPEKPGKSVVTISRLVQSF